jgi:hypothetical protein
MALQGRPGGSVIAARTTIIGADFGRSRDDDGAAKIDPKLTYIMALGFMHDAGAGSRGRLEFLGDLFDTR